MKKNNLCGTRSARGRNRHFVRDGKRRLFYYRQRPGVSLIIGLILVGIITFFAIITTIGVVDSIRQSSAVNNASVAYYASEGAVETGLLENLANEVGYNTSGTKTMLFGGDSTCMTGGMTPCQACCYSHYLPTPNDPQFPNDLNSINKNVCDDACKKFCGLTSCNVQGGSLVKSTFKIEGTVPANKLYGGTYYGIPAPGTGSAGKDCDPLQIPYLANSNITGNFWYSKSLNGYKYQDTTPGSNYTGQFTVIDHPCNWGKIGEGQTVSIPLYYTDAGVAKNIIESGSTFILKVRTPCKDGSEVCVASIRYALAYGQMNTNYYYNDPIMSWQIAGTDKDDAGKQYNLNAILNIDSLNNNIKELSTTIISEKRISLLASNFEVLNNTKYGQDLNGCKGSISDFLNNSIASFSSWSPSTDQCDTVKYPSYLWTSQNQKMDKPVLKLSVIGGLFDNDTSNKVPYLEYQILMSGTTNPPTNSVQTITGESVSGSFKQILEVKVPQESGILEYVIQQ